MQLRPGEYFGATTWERRLNGIRLSLCSYPACRVQPFHRHASPTFFLLLRGNHRDQTKDGVLDQLPCSLVFHPTTTDHSGELGPKNARGLNIEFEPEWLSRHELTDHDLRRYSVFQAPRSRLQALKYLALAFQSGSRVDAELEMQSLELLAPISHGSVVVKNPIPWLRRVEDYLQASFRESISLRDVAQQANIHPVYLARVFRKRHGCTVSEYLRSLRLAEASRLVLEGASLSQSAYAAGFADQAHFSRSCSSLLGFTPKSLFPIRSSIG